MQYCFIIILRSPPSDVAKGFCAEVHVSRLSLLFRILDRRVPLVQLQVVCNDEYLRDINRFDHS